MLRKIQQSIHIQILMALIILGAFSIFISISIQQISNQSSRLESEQNKILRLSDSIEKIGLSSQIYNSNAARDYESYYRDLDVYYKVTVEQLNSIDNQYKNLESIHALLKDIGASPINLLSKQELRVLEELIANSSSTWRSFYHDLQDKFGDNKEEPRLEWGAVFIVDNLSSLTQSLSVMLSQFEKINNHQLTLSKIGAQVEIYLIIIFILLFALFFYSRVIKPINKTREAFTRVSNGDFGHQIQDFYSNEIGELVSSFNEMSARSNTVLSILSKLQTAETPNEIIELIQAKLYSYTGCDLVSLVSEDSKGDGFDFRNIAPVKNFKNLAYKKVLFGNQAERDHIKSIFTTNAPIRTNNISEFIKLNRNSILLRTLLNLYPLKSCIVIPLSINTKPSILLLASYHESKLQDKHLDLIQHLLPFIKHKLSSFNR
ncbi:MAG: HAMP domain-containing protein [Kangiellaceae bacterium]|nr:HAMP domain-containing protein [Kangiellaceae bacterium]MCW9017251.1 HAMP domain-containing protein [Kangiellaceae bacterium]